MLGLPVRYYLVLLNIKQPTRWPRVLRCGPAAVLLLGLRVQTRPGGGNIVCCQVEASVTSRSFVQKGPTECVCPCV